MNVFDQVSFLIVEDEQQVSDYVKHLLEMEMPGCYVDIAADYQIAMEKLSENIYDEIILDLVLPKAPGRDTFNKIHDKAPSTPVLVVTGKNPDDSEIDLSSVKHLMLKGTRFPAGGFLWPLMMERGQKPISILSVEDDADFAFLLRTLLSPEIRAGMFVFNHVMDAHSVTTFLEKECPDIALLDLGVPGVDLDGLEALKDLFTACSKISILVISSHTGMAKRCKEMGSDGFISKDSITGKLLASKIQDIVYKKRLLERSPEFDRCISRVNNAVRKIDSEIESVRRKISEKELEKNESTQ